MNLKNLSISELYALRSEFISEGLSIEKISDLILEKESIYIQSIQEDGPGGAAAAASIGVGGGGVAYSNASIGGMGQVVSSQPSTFAGATTEPGFSAGGGRTGSGDISVAYNPGGRKKVFQKIAAKMDNRKGTNKRRKNKLIQGLKNVFSQKQDYTAGEGGSKMRQPLMNFDKFSKDKMNRVTVVKQ
jgi:hypothetical protein